MSTILPLHQRSLRHGQAPPPQKYKGRLERRIDFLPNWVRNESIAFIAEFCGTFMFLFFAFAATQVANAAALRDGDAATQSGALSQAPNATTLLYISLSFGFSLCVNVWIFFRISGGLFNPAVTLALFLIDAIKPVRACLCFVAQILGGICAAAITSAILPGNLNVSTNLGGGTTIARGLFLEMFLTTELVLAILFLAAEKHKATYLAPVGIGLALFVAEMTGVYFTGGSLNPARSFGPAVIVGTFPGYHWIYWLGPVMGACVATGFYKLMKLGDYETVNPGQDFDDQEAEMFKPPEDAETAEDVARPNPTAIAAETAMEQAKDEIVRSVSPEKARVSRHSQSSTIANPEAEKSLDQEQGSAPTSSGEHQRWLTPPNS